MKILLIACLLWTSFNPTLLNEGDKETVTAEITVNGVCGMCEERIENAALIKGVKSVEWQKEAQTLKVVYRADKTNPQRIQEAIAAIGHDTQDVKASDEAYSKLHRCCSYREMEVH